MTTSAKMFDHLRDDIFTGYGMWHRGGLPVNRLQFDALRYPMFDQLRREGRQAHNDFKI